MKNVLAFSKQLLEEHLDNGAVVVDATVGNGNDTLFLCQNYKFVYGFDIQQLAVDNTRTLLQNHNLTNYELICDSHENVLKYVESVDGAIFNLGYLPNADKFVTTKFTSTISAIDAILKILNKNGVIVVVLYTGHDDAFEANNVEEFLTKIDKTYSVLKYQFINRENAPYIIAIHKP